MSSVCDFGQWCARETVHNTHTHKHTRIHKPAAQGQRLRRPVSSREHRASEKYNEPDQIASQPHQCLPQGRHGPQGHLNLPPSVAGAAAPCVSTAVARRPWSTAPSCMPVTAHFLLKAAQYLLQGLWVGCSSCATAVDLCTDARANPGRGSACACCLAVRGQ
eukprot:1161925-Pelagomonas_calceolata.AAC.10